jgi:hypothetical protein
MALWLATWIMNGSTALQHAAASHVDISDVTIMEGKTYVAHCSHTQHCAFHLIVPLGVQVDQQLGTYK